MNAVFIAMNTIRHKLKHGFGNRKKSVQRPTVAQPSVSTTGIKPDKIIKEESETSTRRSRKTKIAKSSVEPSETSSQSKASDSKSQEGSDMERKRKKKSIHKNRKQKSFFNNDGNPGRKSARICDSLHEGRLVLQTKLDIHIDELFKLLFTNSEFFREFQAKRQTTELQVGEWKTNRDGQKVRLVSMTLFLHANVGPKTSKIIEEQILRKCSNPGELYSIDIKCINEGIPYADVFNVLVHYCLMDAPNKNTQMMVYVNVNFIKPTWAVIKTFIIKHSLEALAIYFSDLQQELSKEIAKSKTNQS